MRRILGLVVLLAAVLLSVNAEAQSCDGCGIGYWYNGVPATGGTFTGPILLPDGTAAAPSLAFASNPEKGMYFVSDIIFNNNTARFAIGQGQTRVSSNMAFGWASGAATSGLDVSLFRDAANTLALRNGTNAQTFNIYNTYTDASNWERASIGWASNIFTISADNAGTGTASRSVALNADGPAGTVILQLAGGNGWSLGNAGGSSQYFQPMADDANPLGQSTNRLTTAYISRSIQGSKSKSLTDAAAAVSFVRIAVGTGAMIGGKVIWTAQSTDGTDQRALSGEHYFSFADKAGTVSCGTPGAVGTAVLTSTNANTLVCTITAATSTTNCDLQVTCTDNTAGSQTMSLNYRLDMPTVATVTPQ